MTPDAVCNWRVYICTSIASLAACMIGYDSAFIGTALALPSMMAEFRFEDYAPSDLEQLHQTIISIYQAGAFFGSLIAYVTVSHESVGRRRALLGADLLFIIGASLMLSANRDRGPSLLIAGRILTGVGVGTCSGIAPAYVAELAPPDIRGHLVGIYELAWQFGGLVGFWISYGVDKTMAPNRSQWLVPFALQLVPSGLLLLGVLYLPESPRWLFLHGHREQAWRELCWLRNLDRSDAYIVAEVTYIDQEAGSQGRDTNVLAPFRLLKQRKHQWRFFLGAILFVFQNGSGINAINYYSPTVFRSLGIRGSRAAFFTTGIFGIVKTSLTLLWLLVLVDRIGRRKLLIAGALGGALCMYFLGAYIKLTTSENGASETPTRGSIAAVCILYLWTVFYSPSWNGTPWVVNAEIFGSDTRTLGQASAAANNWLWNFIVARFTEQMFRAWGFGVYLFFATFMVISAVFVFFCLPETKALPLETMDCLFAMRPTWHAHEKLSKELREREATQQGTTEGS